MYWRGYPFHKALFLGGTLKFPWRFFEDEFKFKARKWKLLVSHHASWTPMLRALKFPVFPPDSHVQKQMPQTSYTPKMG